MKFEVLKTVILICLVSLSLLLTLGIWNYQGDYETSNTDTVTDAELNGSDATKRQLIQPSQIIFHDGEIMRGLKDKQVEVSLFQDMMQWSLYDFEMIPEDQEMTVDETYQVIEINFPTSIPSSVINEIFTTDDSMLIDSKFKKIYVYVDEDRQMQQIVFDNPNQGGIDIRASVQNMTQVIDFYDQIHMTHKFTTYEEVELHNEQTIYIPNEVNITGKKFRYESINPDEANFQYIFFPDPSTVAHSPNVEGGQVYNDDKREVVVRGYSMEYTNFSTADNAREQDSAIESTENASELLIRRTIEYINNHNGWLVDQGIRYQLYQLNDISQSVEYRMIYDNYPVFSNDGLATMMVALQNNSVYQYNRPLMSLTYAYDRATTELMLGTELIDYLQTSDRFEYNQILDIQLGYRLEEQAGGQVFDLIPTWCVKTYSGWEYVTNDASSMTQGGTTDAMESN